MGVFLTYYINVLYYIFIGIGGVYMKHFWAICVVLSLAIGVMPMSICAQESANKDGGIEHIISWTRDIGLNRMALEILLL